ncbi:MAG: MBL fold metallo-hydrolase [Saprospiraceae bacterium]
MSKKIKISLVAFVTIIAFSIIGCRSLQPQRVTYQLPPSQLKNKNWEQIFDKKTKIDSFKILNTGSVKVPLNGMLNEDKLSLNHGLNDFLWVDVFVFLFHHEKNGWFMIDTGLDSTFQKKGNINGILAGKFIKDTKQKKSQNIEAQLKKENKSINGIFLTHLHGDHTAGLPEIDSSIPKYIGKGEEYISIPLIYRSNHLTKKDTLKELDWESGFPIYPLESVIDIFGDGSFLGIHTPGHSNSHLSYLLMTSEGPILLTGDASHTKYGFENKIEPGWVDDQKIAENSLRQLVEFHAMHPIIRVINGHEK